MERPVIQTQHSSFDDWLTVHPIRRLQQRLLDDNDSETLDRLIFLSKEHIPEQYEKIMSTDDEDGKFERWIDALETKLNKLNSVRVFANLVDSESMKNAAELLQQYIEEWEEYRRRKQQQQRKDANFTGREDIMEQIIGVITSPTDIRKGVIVRGVEGIGKTSLAEEVCHRLVNDRHPWDILVCNQRETSDFQELLINLVSLFNAEKVVGPDADVDSLKLELRYLINKNAKSRQILWIDNLDEQLKENQESVMGLLKDIGNTQKLRLLVTIGNNLTFDLDLHGLSMLTLELEPLSQEETSEMLKKVSKQLTDKELPTSICDKLRELCIGNTMGLQSVAAMLRACPVNEIIKALTVKGDPDQSGQLKVCIHKAMNLLSNHPNLLNLLVAVSLFQSAQFDMDAALAVGLSEADHMSTKHDKKDRMEQVVRDLNILKSYNLVEIDKLIVKRSINESEAYDMPQSQEPASYNAYNNEKTESSNAKQKLVPDALQKGKQDGHVYSLHPIVFRNLKKLVREDEDLMCQYKKARINFLNYFYSIITKCGQFVNMEPLEAQKLMEHKVVHIREWFKLLTRNEDDQDWSCYVRKLKQKHAQHHIVREHKRIWKVAELVMAPRSNQRQLFAKKQAELAKGLRLLYEYIHWTCLESEDLLLSNRWELAEKRIKELQSVFEAETYGQEENVTWIETANDRMPTFATLYVVKGMICWQKGMMTEALDHFSTAEILYEGKSKVIKLMDSVIGGKHGGKKNLYTHELAQVVAVKGELFIEMKQLDEASKCHEFVLDLFKRQPCFLRALVSICTSIGLSLREEAEAKDGDERQKCLEEACEMFSRSLKFHKSMNLLKRDKAYLLTRIADVYHCRGLHEEALRNAEKALDIYRESLNAPNVHLTVAMSMVGLYHLELGRSKELEGQSDLEKSVRQYDKVLENIMIGGLPQNPQDGTWLFNIKDYHMEGMRLLDYPERLVQQRVSKYEEFESGSREKEIERIKDTELDFDAQDFTSSVIEKGTSKFVPLSDSDDESEEPGAVKTYGKDAPNTSAVLKSKDNELPGPEIDGGRNTDSEMDIIRENVTNVDTCNVTAYRRKSPVRRQHSVMDVENEESNPQTHRIHSKPVDETLQIDWSRNSEMDIAGENVTNIDACTRSVYRGKTVKKQYSAMDIENKVTSPTTLGTPEFELVDDMLSQVSTKQHSSTIALIRNNEMTAEAMDVDEKVANEVTEVELGMSSSDLRGITNVGTDEHFEHGSAVNDGTEMIRKVVNSGPPKPYGIQRQASIDLSQVPESGRCSFEVTAMRNTTNVVSEVVFTSCIEDSSVVGDLKPTGDSSKSNGKEVKADIDGIFDVALQDSEGKASLASTYNRETSFNSMTARNRRISSASMGSRDSVFSQSSQDRWQWPVDRLSISSCDSMLGRHQSSDNGMGSTIGSASMGSVDRSSKTSYDSGYGSRRSSEETARCRKISSAGRQKKDGWASASDERCREDFSSCSRDSVENSSMELDTLRLMKRKSLDSIQPQWDLMGQIRQLFNLTPQWFEDAKKQVSLAKKSRLQSM